VGSTTLSFLALIVLLAASPARALQPAPPLPPPSDEYRIGVGDALQLFVWKEPELSRELTVRFDGRVTVPLLGEVDAKGHTPAQLSREIAEKLQRFIEAPQVTVSVAPANSTQFFVLGQVTRPGAYPMTGRTTLLQALAQAQGFKEFAKLDRIVIVRGPEGEQTFLTVNYKKLEAGADVSQNVVLSPGDTVLVP